MKRLPPEPFAGLLQLLNRTNRFVLLETSRPTGENNRTLLFTDPVHRLQCSPGMEPHRFVAQMEDWLARGYYLAGWIGYEFGYLLEESLAGLLSRPGDGQILLADLGVFRAPFSYHHETGETDLPLNEDEPPVDLGYRLGSVRVSEGRLKYLRNIRTIKEYIAAGDTYQVNYTLKLLFELNGSTEGLYRDLRRNQSVSYGAYIRWDDERILSFSPELFFARRGGTITVRPMKGTMVRGRTLEEDRDNQRFLSNDPKNRSENVMIVDLLRNDLSHLMHRLGGGKVRVESLFDVEVYETLLQMTSTIRGEQTGRLSTVSLLELFKALFPCGSVTGAPKIRTMEIINELESGRRGVYTGAIGYLAPNGEAGFNVPIRTIVMKGEQAEMGIGSGIVHDSDPEQEWQECLLKGRFLTRPAEDFLLIETLLWEPGKGYWLLEDHLNRLRDSADYFLFSHDPAKVVQRLEEAAATFPDQWMRVRMTLAKDSRIELSWVNCDPPRLRQLPQQPEPLDQQAHQALPRITLSRERVDSSSPEFFHKTSRRSLFNREFKRATADGLFDICFVNTYGKVTEGCITNIFLHRDGKYLTPPVRCGLLAGVMRHQLLMADKPTVEEREVTPEDLQNAEAIFLCNSVRGVVRVRLKHK